MARYYDIKAAFSRSVTQDQKRGIIVTTQSFLDELALVNHYWSLEDANQWIMQYQSFFREFSSDDKQNKKYFLMNMGYIR